MQWMATALMDSGAVMKFGLTAPDGMASARAYEQLAGLPVASVYVEPVMPKGERDRPGEAS